MTRKTQNSFQDRKAKFLKNFLIAIEILFRFAIAFTLTLLCQKATVYVAAYLTKLSGIRIFIVTGFFANFLSFLLPFFAFLATMLVIRPIPMGKRRPVKPKKTRKKLSIEVKLLIITYSLALISLVYSSKNYIAVTDDRIYISMINNLFERKEYSFAAVEGVKIRGKRGKGGASIKFLLQLDGHEIDIWPGGMFDRENIVANVRRVYQALKKRNIPLDADLSYLSEKQVSKIQRILE